MTMTNTGSTSVSAIGEEYVTCFERTYRNVSEIDLDIRSMIVSAIGGNTDQIMMEFKAAEGKAAAVGKEGRLAVTAAWNLVSKRMHYYAGLRNVYAEPTGYVLTLPRLDGKGDGIIKLTPKAEAKLQREVEQADRLAESEQANREFEAREAYRKHEKARSRTTGDIYSEVVMALNASQNASAVDVAALLIAGLNETDSRELVGHMVTLGLVAAPRKRNTATKARKTA